MLGSLGRWLRMAGYDVVYAGDLDGGDEAILGVEGEGRVLVTRDVELAERYGDSVLLESRELEEQLAAVASDLGLVLEPVMERCTLCNSPLEEVDEGEAEGVEYVPEGAEGLHRCTGCGQFFWRGSHWEDIEERLERVRKVCRDR